MNIAIATHSGLYIGEFEDNQLAIRELSKGYYYGLSCKDGKILAGRRVDPTSESKDSPSAFEVWTYDGLCLGTPYELNGNNICDIHQITPSSEGHYICAGTTNNVIFVTSDFNTHQEIILGKDVIGAQLINSIHVDGDDLYFMQHNREVAPSEIIHLQHIDNEWIFCNNYRLTSFGSHNIFVHDDYAYYCASDAGAVRRVLLTDYDTEDWEMKGAIRAKELVLDPEKHTKGLAADPDSDTLIIGISDNGTLEERFTSESYLIVLSFSDLDVRHSYRLWKPDGTNLGNINEIRILD